MSVYNKLIRDRIPEIIENGGDSYQTRILDKTAYIKALEEKAFEELKEYQGAADAEEALEELADLMEVIHALIKVRGFTVDELESVRKSKTEKRGAFSERIFLIDVKESGE
ncbi:nucleoside triphosphate pyrophosphohydrolase [Alkalihalobacillus sp. TS-13]|uniref:nucleoside triphosphate pyrophosphohydrolase n=1 Tax=Alkalihalobacillus sp. TS-13 TaxID=2842455 RepID=UPI001C87C878|nr:nucleoside triphosphate pyrophosphohydrolase [Alkalihalobacillus sp. TS-13]